MYRLLFTTKDNLHQLTVITDGIDSQLNVFVTENTVGDVDYFESLGIVIRAGLTYNIGQFKEWAMNNILRLIAYPEEYEGKEQILVDIVEEMRYFLIPQDKTMAFPKEGDSIEAVVTSYKQLYVNGKPTGVQTPLEVDFETKSPYTVSKGGTVTIAENPTTSVRNGVLTVTQHESNKKITINLTQAASVITYEYSLLPTPTNISFAAAGESKSFNVVSVKQKKLNGNDSGSPVNVGYTTTVSGAGFTKGSNDTTVVAAENTAESQRTGKVTISAVEGGKTAEITLTQAAAVVTYEYTLDVDPDSLSFIAAGETKIFSVSSKKQKKVNGKISGPASAVNYTTTVTGEGFSKGDSEYSVIAANNTGSQRTGQAKVAASEGGKTITVTLTQAGV
jgi:hypothetical protein